jgi:hypothetical protein
LRKSLWLRRLTASNEGGIFELRKILSKLISQPALATSDILRWSVSIVLLLIFGFGENLAQ